MKKIFLVFILIYTKLIFGQKIIIRDSVSKSPIENVSLSFKQLGVTSDKNGVVDITMFENDDTIDISHISYKTKSILKKEIKNIIYLSKKTFILPVIVLNEINKISISDKYPLFTIRPSGFVSRIESSTANLLSSQSSIVVQESQSGGGSPNYRGMEANRLLLVIDEVPLNNAIYRSGHLQNSASINPFFVESISLVTGPGSTAYGDGAMGGALVFNTLNPLNKTAFCLHQQFESSSNTIVTNFKANYFFNKTSHISAFSFKSSGNLRMGENRYHGYRNWGNERVSREQNEQLYTNYAQADFMHKSKYQINNKNSILFNTQYSTSTKIYRFDKMNDMTGDLPKYENWYYGPQIRFLQNINYNYRNKTYLYDNIRGLIAFQNIKESRHTQKSSESLLNNRNENVKIYDYNIDFNKRIKKIQLAYGLGRRSQKIISSASLSDNKSSFYNTTRYPEGGSSVLDLFAYSQINIPFVKKLNLIIGGRWNHSKITAEFNNPTFIFDDLANTTTSFVKSGLITFKPNPKTMINAAYYGGFRSPNLDDLGKVFSKDDKNVVVPNSNLRPEYADNIELGYHYSSSVLNISLQIFNIQISNAISREYGSINGVDSMMYDSVMMRVQMNKNIQSAIINGISFKSELNANNNLKIGIGCNQIVGKTNENKPLAHIPPFNAKLTVEYSINKNLFLVYSDYNGWKLADSYDELGVDNLDEATIDGNPSWYTINLAYSNNISNDIKTTFSVKNILDAHYKTFGSGLSASGRNFIFSLEAFF